jgi:RecB family exonuclease
MPTPPKPSATAARITAWSFSRWNDYRKCPKFAYFKHVLRLKEPGNEAMDRGAAIGELAEKFAKASKRAKCPAELKTFEQEFRDLQGRVVMSEEEWAFTKEWKKTGWFDKDAWCRVKVDCAFVDETANKMTVIDYKTGKINELHLEQLSLYALAGFLVEETVAEVEVQLWYLDHGVLKPDQPKVYSRKDVPALKKEWEKNTKPMLSDGRFQEKASKACTWCHFSKAKGGPCKF